MARYLSKHGELIRMTDHYYYHYVRPDGKEIIIKCSRRVHGVKFLSS